MKGFEEYTEQTIDYKEICQTIISKIQSAKQPLILAGYGVRSAKATKELLEFSKVFNIPIVTSRGGIDIIPSDNDLFIGRPGSYGDRASHFAIQKCDFLLILGSRLSVSTIGYYPDRFAINAFKIMIDIDTKELDKNDVPVDIKIRGDIKEFLQVLNQSILKQDISQNRFCDWIKSCDNWKKLYPNVLKEYSQEKPLNEYYVTSVLADLAADNANIIVDTGSVCSIVSQSWKIKMNQRYLISGGLSCMGFWATAIGAYQKGRQLIAITGDGSAQMNIQELATIKYNKIPLKLFIYNNNGYMLIRHNQHNYMNDRFLGVGPDSGLQTPDFVKVALAYEIESVRITDEDNIEEKLDYVLSSEDPIVCEIIVKEFAPIIPRIASKVMPDGSLKAAEFDDLYPFLD